MREYDDDSDNGDSDDRYDGNIQYDRMAEKELNVIRCPFVYLSVCLYVILSIY